MNDVISYIIIAILSTTLIWLVGNYANNRVCMKSKEYSTLDNPTTRTVTLDNEIDHDLKEKTTKPIRMLSMNRSASKSVELNQQKKQTQFERPVSIKRLIESDIGSLDDEFKKLKEVDERFHVLKFSNKVAKKFVVSSKADGTKTEKHNR